MYRLTHLLIVALLAAAVPQARAESATTFLADFSNYSFFNSCTNESVLTLPGSYLHGVLRVDLNSGVHLVNRASGHIMAQGVWSGDSYTVNIRDDAVPLANQPNIVNIEDGNGAVSIVTSLEIIQPGDPTSGVFVGNTVVVLSFVDDTLVARVVSLTGECH